MNEFSDMDGDDDRDRAQAMIDWLSDKSPDVWYVVSADLNWDNSIRVLDWIVSQPQCDRANAAFILWGCDPLYYMRTPQRDGITSDGLDLMDKILRNWKFGFYTRGEFALIDNHRLRYFELLETLPGKTDPFSLPNDILGPIKGRVPNVPQHLLAPNNRELRKLLWDLGADVGHAPDSPEATRIVRREQRHKVWHFWSDFFVAGGSAASWMLPVGVLVIIGAFVLRWWNKGVVF